MKSSIKSAISIGTVTFFLAGTAAAVVPGLPGDKSPFGASTPVFDQWSVNNGVIAASGCTGDFTCGDAITDNGFYMRLINDQATGEMYFQTITTETDANVGTVLDDLSFSDENFVSGANNRGILDKQRITQDQTLAGTSTIVRFENFTEIGSGWASDFIALSQTINEQIASTTVFEDFQTNFVFHQDGQSSDAGRGVGMKITQYVPILNDNVNLDNQDLVLIDLRGSYAPTGGEIAIGSNTFIDQNQLGGGTIDWVSNDRIYAAWIGQDISATAGQQFGFVAYDVDPATLGERIQSVTLADSWQLGNNDDTGGNVSIIPGNDNGDASTTWSTSRWGNLVTTGSVDYDGTNGAGEIWLTPPFAKSHPAE